MKDFGNIKLCFNNLFIEGVVNKDKHRKDLFKKYLKAIKENEILKTQFLVYNNIEKHVDADFNSANMFLSENLNLFNKFKHSEIKKANVSLFSLLPNVKGLNEGNIEGTTDDIKNLYESLDILISTKPSGNNIKKITEAKINVINFINKNKIKEIGESYGVANNILSKFLLEKFIEKYSKIDGFDIKILDVIFESDFTKKENIYKQVCNECIIIIDNLLVKEDNELSNEKLVLVKEKLLNDKNLTEQEFLDKYIRLIELKNNLIK